jgi:Protein of unknown function (DUF2934)
MLPSTDQIAQAAYHRWLRRGGEHGKDRDDWYAAQRALVFELNYELITSHALDSPGRLVLGDASVCRCRFCERTAPRAVFSEPRPVVVGLEEISLYSAEICDECHGDCREPLAGDIFRLLETVRRDAEGAVCSVAAFKALVSSALLVLPASELPYFCDTTEWVGNPDHECDGNLLAGGLCQTYRASFLEKQASVSLFRRIDDRAPMPYMILFLVWHGVAVAAPLPLGVRDQDLDGRSVTVVERAFRTDCADSFREAWPTGLPVVASARRARLSAQAAFWSR